MVDVFTKYGWIIVLKDKHGISLSKALNDIFSKIKEKTKFFYGQTKEKNSIKNMLNNY